MGVIVIDAHVVGLLYFLVSSRLLFPLFFTLVVTHVRWRVQYYFVIDKS